jgi:hypothetical protein
MNDSFSTDLPVLTAGRWYYRRGLAGSERALPALNDRFAIGTSGYDAVRLTLV